MHTSQQGASTKDTQTDAQRQMAQKFLELARAEILDKVRFVNQTLGAYLLGSCAIASWFYQLYRPAAPQAADLTLHHQQTVLVGLCVLLSYLALGVSWTINHNERMITALALYQRFDLHPYFAGMPPMWEASYHLRKRDGQGAAFITILVQMAIILAPPVSSLAFLWFVVKFPPSHTLLFDVAITALVATAVVAYFGFLTAADRFLARRKAAIADQHSSAPGRLQQWLKRAVTRTQRSLKKLTGVV